MRKAKVVKDFIGLREIFQNQRRSCVVCVTVAVGWISKTSLSTLLGHTEMYQEAETFRLWERLKCGTILAVSGWARCLHQGGVGLAVLEEQTHAGFVC